MTAKLIILTLFLAAVKAYLPSCQDANDSVICKLTEKYEKSLPCEPYPLNLTQIITVHDVVNMNAKEQTITVFLQLMSIWNDTRITAKLNGSDWIIVDEKVAKDVYFPKMTFLRSKSTKELEIFGPNYPYFWMMLPHHLEYRELLKVEFFCDFDFSQYPFDQHECKLIFGSNFLSNFYVNLVPTIVKSSDGKQTLPGQKPIEVVNTNLPFKIHLESMQSFLSENIGFNYTHSWIKISFQRRHFSTLSGQFYIPVSVFISFSLISYSINPEMVPGRLGLLVTLCLIVTNIYGAVEAPSSRGFSHIELWLLCMQVPIAVAIIEYGFVLTQMKYFKNSKDSNVVMVQTQSKDKILSPEKKCGVKKIDKWTFWWSLCYIVGFNLAYWLFILHKY